MRRRRWIMWWHLPAVAWSVIVEWTGWMCPLTPVENWLRSWGEEAGYTGSFIDQYVTAVLYPAGLSPMVHRLLGVAVLSVNLVLYWRMLSSPRAARHTCTMVYILLGLLSLSVVAWVWVTQPLLSSGTMPHPLLVEPQRLEAHVRTLAETFFPRDAAHAENLDRAAAYIRQAFAQAGARVSDQPYQVGETTYRNVTALFGPETPERIVVGAHYDTAGPQPGADDNASGVAGVLELARLLGTTTLPVCVELVAFTLEESPHFSSALMGSAVHAQSLQQRGIAVRIMLSLEMIGYFTDVPHSQRFPFSLLAAFYPTTGNFIAVVGKLDHGLVVRRVKQAMRQTSPLPVYSINAPRFVRGIDFSDHRSYWDRGYTAVMITDTAFYRNPNYHTSNDTPDTLDYQRMAMVVQGVYAAIRAFAD